MRSNLSAIANGTTDLNRPPFDTKDLNHPPVDTRRGFVISPHGPIGVFSEPRIGPCGLTSVQNVLWRRKFGGDISRETCTEPKQGLKKTQYGDQKKGNKTKSSRI